MNYIYVKYAIDIDITENIKSKNKKDRIISYLDLSKSQTFNLCDLYEIKEDEENTKKIFGCNTHSDTTYLINTSSYNTSILRIIYKNTDLDQLPIEWGKLISEIFNVNINMKIYRPDDTIESEVKLYYSYIIECINYE